MKKREIAVGQLRQNPTPTLHEVEQGLPYIVVRNGKAIAKLVPITEDDRWVTNRDRVDELLARGKKPDNSAWLAEIEADRRAEEGIDW